MSTTYPSTLPQPSLGISEQVDHGLRTTQMAGGAIRVRRQYLQSTIDVTMEFVVPLTIRQEWLAFWQSNLTAWVLVPAVLDGIGQDIVVRWDGKSSTTQLSATFQRIRLKCQKHPLSPLISVEADFASVITKAQGVL